ncbi:hypothetical protein HJ526_00955 [Donghicola sp. C2-DW-16]|uniref:Secreted protein n=1 Tax=Donghicola mangrovi TaxID=2729614 RepID=A0ABX2P950_9RHOB|nr:hypothetical protein [Donghicola mangrovi]NVO25975.1 hypothetical protein [Donghicola mangrovi]
MRLNLVALVIGGCGLAMPASAQSILAGEHEGFTRLAVRQLGDVDPRVILEEGQLQIFGAAPVLQTDLKDALNKIGASRIGSINANDNGISVGLNCACGTKTFTHQGYYVIDILEKASEEVTFPLVPPAVQNTEWGSFPATLSAKCLPGTWCEEFLTESSTNTKEPQKLCRFENYVVDYAALSATSASEATELKRYFDQGWVDEAHLALREASAAEEWFIMGGAKSEAGSCFEMGPLEQAAVLEWRSKADKQADTWLTEKMAPIQIPEPVTHPEVDHPISEPEAIAPTPADQTLQDRAQALLDSYREAAQ